MHVDRGVAFGHVDSRTRLSRSSFAKILGWVDVLGGVGSSASARVHELAKAEPSVNIDPVHCQKAISINEISPTLEDDLEGDLEDDLKDDLEDDGRGRGRQRNFEDV